MPRADSAARDRLHSKDDFQRDLYYDSQPILDLFEA